MRSLEEEIQVKQFTNSSTKTELNIIYTAGFISSRSTRFFKKYDLSMQQYNVLRILRGAYPNCVNLNDITSRMLDKMSNATRLVEKLRIKKLSSRDINPKNRREVLICITEQGLLLLKKIDADLSTIMDNRYDMLSEEEKLKLNQLLDKIRTNETSS